MLVRRYLFIKALKTKYEISCKKTMLIEKKEYIINTIQNGVILQMEQRTYAEQIVKCKRSGKTFFLQTGMIILAVVLLAAMSFIPAIAALAPAIAVVIVVAAFLLIRRMNIEYEYTVVESRLDIDCIRGKSDRKRILTVDVKNFDCLAQVESAEEMAHLKRTVQTVHHAAPAELDGCWYATFSLGGEEGKTLLVFKPNERVIDIIQRYVPQRNIRKATAK